MSAKESTLRPSERLAAWSAERTPLRRALGLRWWKEALIIAPVYLAYGFVRNQFGSAAVEPEVAARNADYIIDIEKALGLYVEADVQDAFIDWTAFIQFWNLFYGLFHFLVTGLVLIWLYHADPARYRFWRRAGLVATTSALIGFAAFPLMPPRLLGNCGTYGACRAGQPYVDTVIDVGGIWSFESTGMESISNQYAAMPSLHIGWALWCALILFSRLGPGWAKALAGLYPWMTMFAIVVTANHYWFDGVGGVVVVAFGCWVANRWQVWDERRSGVVDSASDASPDTEESNRELARSEENSD